MEQHVIYQRIGYNLEDIEKLKKLHYSMSSTDIQRYRENYEVLATDAAIRAEKIACRMRHIVLQSTRTQKHQYLEMAAEAIGINISYSDGILVIQVPAVMPGRKQSQSTEFLLDPLYFSLNRFFDKQSHLPRYNECVVHFMQEYDTKLSRRRIRDYDNLELKQMLDIITAFVMVDDGGECCEVHSANRLGKEDRTIISIMHADDFGAWHTAQRAQK